MRIWVENFRGSLLNLDKFTLIHKEISSCKTYWLVYGYIENTGHAIEFYRCEDEETADDVLDIFKKIVDLGDGYYSKDFFKYKTTRWGKLIEYEK